MCCLYDLTSTYFESDPPLDDEDKRRYGYSRDHRPDCVQVVIALVVTPEGLPLAYEVLAGNTARLHHARRISSPASSANTAKRGACGAWIAACPTEEVLAEMRAAIRRCSTWWARRRGA